MLVPWFLGSHKSISQSESASPICSAVFVKSNRHTHNTTWNFDNNRLYFTLCIAMQPNYYRKM